MNLMGAINLESMQLIIESYKIIDREAMLNYSDRIKEAYPKAPLIHLILDQGSCNISRIKREAAEKRGVRSHYLPPYSLNLNPIERFWKLMSEHFPNNRFFQSAKKFRNEIINFFSVTWQKIAVSYPGRINDNFQQLNSALSF